MLCIVSAIVAAVISGRNPADVGSRAKSGDATSATEVYPEHPKLVGLSLQDNFSDQIYNAYTII